VNVRPRHLLAAVLVAAIAAIAAGCGGDEGKQIPRAQAREIVVKLQEADRRLSQEPPVCGDLAEQSIPELERLVATLPSDVDKDIRETLDDGVAHLRDQIEAECAERRQQQQDTTTDTTDTTDTTTDTTTETTPPTTDTTETTPPTTDTQPTTPTTPTTPNSGGQSPGQQKRQKKQRDRSSAFDEGGE
jgi:hypothetical protein